MLAVIGLVTVDPAFARRRIAVAPEPSGPALEEIAAELEKPLPPLENTDAEHLLVLQQPPALGLVDSNPWPNRLKGLAVYTSLFVFGWCIATGRLPRKLPGLRFASLPHLPELRRILPQRRVEAPSPRAQRAAPPLRTVQPPAPVPSNTPEPLTNPQIIHLKALTSFESWQQLLTAARAGSRIAREVLDSTPGHAAVQFRLTAADFTRDFAYVRNVVLSRIWVAAILELLREAERFDAVITITTPFGRRLDVPLDAPIEALNTVLGYEGVPPQVRRQLELRRWILWQTRTDGQSHPEVLAGFIRLEPVPIRAASAGCA